MLARIRVPFKNLLFFYTSIEVSNIVIIYTDMIGRRIICWQKISTPSLSSGNFYFLCDCYVIDIHYTGILKKEVIIV